MAATSALLTARDLTVVRAQPGGRREAVLKGCSLTAHSGQVTAIMGASGSGKSTLLLALAQLIDVESGDVHRAPGVSIAMALQRPESMMCTDSVEREVALALEWNGIDTASSRGRAREVLSAVGIAEHLLSVDPLSLSGGEQRRVAIAAVIAHSPNVVLFDEPSAGLDHASQAQLGNIVRALSGQGIAVIMATHDGDEAAALADQLVVLSEGQVAYSGDPRHVLASAQQCARLGISAPAATNLVAQVGARVGGHDQLTSISIAAAADEVVRLARLGTPAAQRNAPANPYSTSVETTMIDRLPDHREPRLLVLAFAVTVTALFAAHSLAGVLVVAATVVAGVIAVRPGWRRVINAVRSIAVLAVALVVAQLLIGGNPEVTVIASQVTDSGLLFAFERVVQVLSVVLASLALTSAATPAGLARGLAWLAAPLRLVRVPVDEMALIIATGLGFVPVLSDELDRLQLAQRARGIAPTSSSPITRARLLAMLLVPLVVLTFRRAHLLAEALVVRGYRRGRSRTQWRQSRVHAGEVVAVGAAISVLVIARML